MISKVDKTNNLFKINYKKIFMSDINILATISLLLFLICTFSACKIVKHDKNNKNKNAMRIDVLAKDLDPKDYIDKIGWDEKIIPYLKENGTDIKKVIELMTNNMAEAKKKYGYMDGTEGRPYNFNVKGEGRILAMNTKSRNGTLDIDLKPYDGKMDLKIQIGPVIQGTAILDTVEFISFNDFDNQVKYAHISKELNSRANKRVLKMFPNEDMKKGKTITFQGSFTLPLDNSINIVLNPIEIKPITGE